MDRRDFACFSFWSETQEKKKKKKSLLRCTRTCTGACDMHNKRSKMSKFQSGENNMYRKLFSQLLLTSSNSFDVVFFSVRNKIISSLLFKKKRKKENCSFTVYNKILWDVTHLYTCRWVFPQIIIFFGQD